MKKLLIDTALEGIEKHLHTQLDRDSLKELRMTCKGRPDQTVIRKKVNGESDFGRTPWTIIRRFRSKLVKI